MVYLEFTLVLFWIGSTVLQIANERNLYATILQIIISCIAYAMILI